MLQEIRVRTQAHACLADITDGINQLVKESGVGSGVCFIQIPHTTAGITVNENADPAVIQDILAELDKRFPWRDGYRHFEGNSAAHIKASLFGFSLSIMVEDSHLVLGTWQGIYLAEFDGPRLRRVLVRTIPDSPASG